MLLTTICARCRSAVIAEPLISSIPNKFMFNLLHESHLVCGEIPLSAVALRFENAIVFRPAIGLRVPGSHCFRPDEKPVPRLGGRQAKNQHKKVANRRWPVRAPGGS